MENCYDENYTMGARQQQTEASFWFEAQFGGRRGGQCKNGGWWVAVVLMMTQIALRQICNWLVLIVNLLAGCFYHGCCSTLLETKWHFHAFSGRSATSDNDGDFWFIFTMDRHEELWGMASERVVVMMNGDRGVCWGIYCVSNAEEGEEEEINKKKSRRRRRALL